MGRGPPPTGGNPCPRRHRARERPWNWSPRRAWSHPPPGCQWRCRQAPRRRQRALQRCLPALKEEEAGLLQFEVGGAFSSAPLISRGSRSPLYFFHRQGVAGRPRPCACQGTEVKDVRDDGAVLGEGAEGGGERGGCGRATACYDRGRKAATRRGSSGGLASVSASRPSLRVRAGSFGEPVRQGPRGGGGPC
jgi:hypothetical protein